MATTMTISLAMMGLAAVGLAGAAQAKPVWATGTFVYADLCTSADSGERAGRRITLKRSPTGDMLLYEAASLPSAARAETVSLDDATKSLAFMVGTQSGALAFHGTLATDALVGTIEDETGTYPLRLRRVLRSHAHEACPADTTGSVAAAH